MIAASQQPVHRVERIERVLIVDDNRDNMLTLGVLLRSEGYIVELAKDGDEALRVASTCQPDLALLDLVLPDRSGFDVARELKRRHGDKCPILVAISAHTGEQTEQRARDSGFRHFIAKPYDPQALLRLIESFDAR